MGGNSDATPDLPPLEMGEEALCKVAVLHAQYFKTLIETDVPVDAAVAMTCTLIETIGIQQRD